MPPVSTVSGTPRLDDDYFETIEGEAETLAGIDTAAEIGYDDQGNVAG